MWSLCDKVLHTYPRGSDSQFLFHHIDRCLGLKSSGLEATLLSFRTSYVDWAGFKSKEPASAFGGLGLEA